VSTDSRSFTRRDVVQAGVLASLSATLPAAFNLAAAASANAIITRPIPATGERIPVMGIGTNRFGSADYEEVKATLKRMHEMGGRVIDTAAGYGHSEEVIGKTLGELKLSDKMFIATKFNAPGVSFRSTPDARTASAPVSAPAAGELPRDSVSGSESFERSLQRLQLKRVDVLFAHFIGSVEPLMPTMLDLKKQGRARYIGITSVQGAQHPQVMEYMRKYPLDFIQIDYSLGDRAAAADVLPLAIERKIAVMLAVPFGGGRNSLFDAVGNRELPQWAAEFGATTWGEFFLKYAISHPAVTCAIPGATKVKHVEENQRAGQGTLPDAAMRKRIEEFWDRGA
jgi:aryl-alcohol dehydrogenase-like predicted oxidoreductase